MKYLTLFLPFALLCSCKIDTVDIPEHFKEVDQVIWVVEDLDKVKAHWNDLGFNQILDLDTAQASLSKAKTEVRLRLALANLGGAHITWIQPLNDHSPFLDFLRNHGNGAMSLVHRLQDKDQLAAEVARLADLGINFLEDLTISTNKGELYYMLIDTQGKGKYVLGFTHGDPGIRKDLTAENRHGMKINQYAFAIREAEPVSQFWAKLGFPEFQINHPVLGETKYYGELVDHELIQGWQRHGTVSYEWCIPVKPPIVYEDHINLHGEGIHHLAYSVSDMDAVLQDYATRGYVNTMGGTWGEEGKPGSGRYEYIGLEEAGGLTMELLWSYPE